MLATTTCEIGSGSEDLMIFTKNGETHRWVFQEAVNLRGKCMELWRLHYLLKKGIPLAALVAASSPKEKDHSASTYGECAQ